MDHSSHGNMDHSSHGNMDHSSHASMGHSGHHSMHARMNSSLLGHDSVMHSGGMHHGSMNSTSDNYTPHHHHSADGHSGHMSGGVHRMFFSLNNDVPFLFDSWSLNTKTGMFFAIIVIIALAIAFQGIKTLREYIHKDVKLQRRTLKSREHILQTILYVSQLCSSYILMLAIMTYNVWVVLATVCGLGLGYFLCSRTCNRKRRSSCSEGMCSVSCSDMKGNTRSTIEKELEPLQNEDDMCTECRETDI